MAPPTNSNESYCTFTLASDVTAGGLPSEAEIAKDLESNDDNVRLLVMSMSTPELFVSPHLISYISLMFVRVRSKNSH
jgi:hypothetical protein